MLEWFADAPDPDAGLFGFRRISESLGSTHWYLKTLRDEGQVAERLARVLATSRYATDLLEREPEGVRMLGEDLTPLGLGGDPRPDERDRRPAGRPGRGGALDPGHPATRAVPDRGRRAVRRDRRGRRSVRRLSRLTDATLEATLEVAGRAVREQRGLDEAPTRMAIVAMGRYGGFELSYGSDADVMFVHEPVSDDARRRPTSYAQAVANELRRLLIAPASDPALVVDADLRPEGKQGPLVRTLASYAAYYAKWSKVWEAQALLRADAVVGDEAVRERFTALVDPLRYPPDGHHRRRRRRDTADQGARRPRAAAARCRPAHPPQARPRRPGRHRVDRPAPPAPVRRRGAGPAQPAHPDRARRRPRRRACSTPSDARGPRPRLAFGQPAAQRDHAGHRQAAATSCRATPASGPAIASILGYGAGRSDEMVNDYLRTTRRARAVVDRVFWELRELRHGAGEPEAAGVQQPVDDGAGTSLTARLSAGRSTYSGHDSTAERASALLALHTDPTLLTLVNVWDVASARVVAQTDGTDGARHGEPRDRGDVRLRGR